MKHSIIVLSRVALLLMLILISTGQPASAQFGSLIKAVKKGYDDTRRTFKKAERDVRNETEKAINNTGKELGRVGINVNREIGTAIDNTGRELERAGDNIFDETIRAGENTVDLSKAIGKYLERQVSGSAAVLQNANTRITEGKLVDALFHLALDPIKVQEDAAFRATQESGWIRSAGAIAANSYGGPGGAAAYAAWQTYKETNGDAELALRAGFIAGFSSHSLQNINNIETIENFDVIKKAVLAGSVGGLAIGLSGGEEKDVLEGFVLAGGMVIIQEGYRNSTGHALDPRAATKDPYCITETTNCDAFKNAYYPDENGNLRIDYSKLDPKASYVGEGFNVGDTRAPYSWTQDRSTFMRSVAKLPGFNAMGLFHDNWVLSWQMSDMVNKATIFPALVLTYYGAGAPLTTKIIDANVNSTTPPSIPNADKIAIDLLLEPHLVLAGTIKDIFTPADLNLDKSNIKKVKDYHVAQTDLAPIGKYIVVRNITNGKTQRVLVTGALPVKGGRDKSQIHLSPLTMEALGVTDDNAVVQTEAEDLVLVSSVDPTPNGIDPEPDHAYFRRGDILSFPNLDLDSKWELTLMGPGTAEIAHFDNKLEVELRPGRYMYLLTNTSEGEFPWGYYGFIKIISEATSASVTNMTNNPKLNNDKEILLSEEFINFNEKSLKVVAVELGENVSIVSDDEPILIFLYNTRQMGSNITPAYFTSGCSSCLALTLIDNDTGVIYIATSGSVFREGKTFFVNVVMVSLDDNDSSQPSPKTLTGKFTVEVE